MTRACGEAGGNMGVGDGTGMRGFSPETPSRPWFQRTIGIAPQCKHALPMLFFAAESLAIPLLFCARRLSLGEDVKTW